MLHLLGGADGAVAILDADRGLAVTYAQLRDRALQLSRSLPPRAGPGLVLVHAANDVDTVVHLFGAWAAGHAVLLADPAAPADARAALERAYEPDVILGPGGESRRADRPGAAVAAGLRLILTTSGSTGSAKGVRLSGAAVEANAQAIVAALDIGPSQRAAATLPLHYTYGLSVLLSHLCAGAGVVLTGASPVQRGFVETLERAEVTSLPGVPYTYALLDRVGFFDALPTTLQRMTQAGGRLPPEAVRRVAERLTADGGGLWVMYGQTEATARIAVLPPDQAQRRAGSVGWAVPGGRLTVERDGRALPAGEVGDVVYSGPNVMWGYCLDRSDLTRGDELGGVLGTGDRGHLDPDGCLWLAGRASRFAKLAGVRVSLDDLETLVPELGDVAAVADGERVVLHVTNQDVVVQRSAARALARRLRLHHGLIEIRGHDGLPRTARGKVDYARLQQGG